MSLRLRLMPGFTALTSSLLLLMLSMSSAHAREARWVGETLEGRPCSDFIGAETRRGVSDYTDPHDRAEKLEIVEKAHFTERVRTLRGGEHQNHPLNDLEYTIGRFPNHHQALYSMIRYATEAGFAEEAERAWTQTRRGGVESLPPECYLQRAMDFARDDHRVRILAGLYYHRVDEYERARTAYEDALAIAPESAEAHYNYGLLLTDMEEFEAAREHASRAYDLGYPLDGLRRRLASAGHPLSD